jgi:adenylate cyclase
LHLIDGNYDAAIDSSQRGVAQEPSNPDTHINLALVLAFAGRPSEAVPVMEEALRLDPNPPAAFELFAGDILFMHGQYEQAIGYLRNALEKTAGCRLCQGGAHLQLAMIYARLNRMAEAKLEVEELLKGRKWVNLEYYRQLYAYHKRKGELDIRLDALGKAGIPQWPTGYEVSGAIRLSNLELQNLVYGHTWFGRSQNKYQTFAQKTAGDGRVTYLQFGTKWEGTVSIDNDRLCYQIPALLLGRNFCGYVYRNPQGSREGKDEYIAVDVFDVHYFSPIS